jgi:hypothetical protein
VRAPTLGWWCAAVFAAGCTCGRSTAECSEPSLWYAPDPSGGVFWGCKPPEGWLAEPPGGLDTARIAAAARAVQQPGVIVPPGRGDAHDTSVVATGTTASTGWTGSTADTGALLADTDAAGPPGAADTATVAPGNTAGPLDTAALVDTGLPVDTVAADTAAVVPVDTAAPADAAQPEVDPGGAP